MADPNNPVDKLIAQLSQIIEHNRQKRQQADAVALGQKQALDANEQAANRTPVLQRSSDKSKLAQASQYDDTGYHRSGAAETKNERGHGDGGFGQAYEDAQFNQAFAKTPGNAPPASLDVNNAIAEEQRKRTAQQYAVAHGQTGPLGGAGTPAPAANPQVAALEKAGSPDLGRFGHLSDGIISKPGVDDEPQAMAPAAPPQPQPMAAPAQDAPPSGWSRQDYDLLSSLAQRYQPQ